jgi:hypothetical protein
MQCTHVLVSVIATLTNSVESLPIHIAALSANVLLKCLNLAFDNGVHMTHYSSRWKSKLPMS